MKILAIDVGIVNLGYVYAELLIEEPTDGSKYKNLLLNSIYNEESFNNKCKIIGIDKFENSFKRSELENNNVRILIGDQGDRNFLEQNLSENRYDLVIDDGSHKYNDQMASFLQIFPYVSYGGLYVVEDLHISTPFARLLKNYHEFQPSITSMIKNIRFYEDKIAFIEKVSY